MKQVISTDKAPQAIGTYSQAVRVKETLYISGQIGLKPGESDWVSDDFEQQTRQVFQNLSAILQAAGGDLLDLVKITVYVTDLKNFNQLNTVMAEFFDAPYPARAAVEVSGLPKGALVEIEGVALLD